MAAFVLSRNSVLVVRFVDGGFVERRRPEVAEVSECGCTLAVVTLVYQLISSTT